MWSRRDLSPFGKITILKSLILPSLNHLFTALPNPKRETITQLQNKFYSFIWNGKPDKVKRTLITQLYCDGGLKTPLIYETLLAQKVSWIRRIYTSNTNINNLFKLYTDKFTMNPIEMGSIYLKKYIIQQIRNPFWRDVIEAWATLLENNTELNDQINKQFIWANDRIRIEKKPIVFKHYIKANIKFVNDLQDDNGKFLSVSELTAKFKIKTNFLEYGSIISAIKSSMGQIDNCNVSYQMPFIPINLSILYRNKKGCKYFYDILNNKNKNINKQNYHLKWENDLKRDISNDAWKIFNIIPFRTTTSTKIRWFQYRIIHRILVTNKDLYRYKLIDSAKCTFCDQELESILHLMTDCSIVKQLWHDLSEWIKGKLQIDIEFKDSDIILGLMEKRNDVLNLIIIVTKQFIYSNRCYGSVPTIDRLKIWLENTYNTHKFISHSSCDYTKFYTFWSSCHDLFK